MNSQSHPTTVLAASAAAHSWTRLARLASKAGVISVAVFAVSVVAGFLIADRGLASLSTLGEDLDPDE